MLILSDFAAVNINSFILHLQWRFKYQSLQQYWNLSKTGLVWCWRHCVQGWVDFSNSNRRETLYYSISKRSNLLKCHHNDPVVCGKWGQPEYDPSNGSPSYAEQNSFFEQQIHTGTDWGAKYTARESSKTGFSSHFWTTEKLDFCWNKNNFWCFNCYFTWTCFGRCRNI